MLIPVPVVGSKREILLNTDRIIFTNEAHGHTHCTLTEGKQVTLAISQVELLNLIGRWQEG